MGDGLLTGLPFIRICPSLISIVSPGRPTILFTKSLFLSSGYMKTAMSPRFGTASLYANLLTKILSPICSVGNIEELGISKALPMKVSTMRARARADIRDSAYSLTVDFFGPAMFFILFTNQVLSNSSRRGSIF